MNKKIYNDIEEKVLSAGEIKRKVKKIGKKINKDYKDKNPVLISILKGSVVFLSDLLKYVDVKCSIDFIEVSSYKNRMESSGVVKMVMDVRESIEGRHVLLVEDIVDTGLTMAYLRDNFMTRKPKSFKICALLDKPQNRQINIDIDYKGFEIPDKFVVGYGLDYMEKYRNIPFVGTLRKEVYKEV